MPPEPGHALIVRVMRRPWYRATLEAVRRLDLPQGAIGAGFVRNAVWDALTGRPRTPLDDVDVLFFDRADPGWECERAAEARLRRALPRPWSVRNQARMHRRNGDRPYRSVAHAMRFWLETPTAVAVRLSAHGRLQILAPHGLDDLLAMRARPTARGCEKPAAYSARMRAKNWPARWPGVTLTLPE
ncbi:MAG: nucleotidyltransferase family protein [Pseudomonadota bacterium]